MALGDYVIGLAQARNAADGRLAGITLNGSGDELPQRGRHGSPDRVGNCSIRPQIARVSDESSFSLNACLGCDGQGRTDRYILDGQDHVSLPDCFSVDYLVDDLPAMPPSCMGLCRLGGYSNDG